MRTIYKYLFLLAVVHLISSCENEKFPAVAISGLWKQVAMLEDNLDITTQADSCYLLFDSNGILRISHNAFARYAGVPNSFFGTWSVLDDTWLNVTTDKWKPVASVSTDSARVNLIFKKDALNQTVIDTTATVQRQWTRYHLQSRFTILKLTDNEMEIRIKTFVGERKYALLFMPHPTDFQELVVDAGKINYSPKLITDHNYWEVQNEYRTLKTYIFKFRKENY